MPKELRIRLAAQNDSAAILQIYTPFIMDTVITFECHVPSMTEFSGRMEMIQETYPWLACEMNGTIIGYAYASRFQERDAYDWSVDFSIYIDPQFHGKSIGKALYFALLEIVKLQGYCNAYACVTLPNTKSTHLHESFGFKTIGVFQNAGYKFGHWHDVIWYGLQLNEYGNEPEKPKSIHKISKTDDFKTIFEKAEQMIRLDS